MFAKVIAPKHLETRFLRINVSNAPFLVVKLKVQVLPCVLAFVSGVSVDRIVGFEGLGRGNDTFTPQQLESRLLQVHVLDRAKIGKDQVLQRSKGKGSDAESEYDDDD